MEDFSFEILAISIFEKLFDSFPEDFGSDDFLLGLVFIFFQNALRKVIVWIIWIYKTCLPCVSTMTTKIVLICRCIRGTVSMNGTIIANFFFTCTIMVGCPGNACKFWSSCGLISKFFTSTHFLMWCRRYLTSIIYINESCCEKFPGHLTLTFCLCAMPLQWSSTESLDPLRPGTSELYVILQ